MSVLSVCSNKSVVQLQAKADALRADRRAILHHPVRDAWGWAEVQLDLSKAVTTELYVVRRWLRHFCCRPKVKLLCCNPTFIAANFVGAVCLHAVSSQLLKGQRKTARVRPSPGQHCQGRREHQDKLRSDRESDPRQTWGRMPHARAEPLVPHNDLTTVRPFSQLLRAPYRNLQTPATAAWPKTGLTERMKPLQQQQFPYPPAVGALALGPNSPGVAASPKATTTITAAAAASATSLPPLRRCRSGDEKTPKVSVEETKGEGRKFDQVKMKKKNTHRSGNEWNCVRAFQFLSFFLSFLLSFAFLLFVSSSVSGIWKVRLSEVLALPGGTDKA